MSIDILINLYEKFATSKSCASMLLAGNALLFNIERAKFDLIRNIKAKEKIIKYVNCAEVDLVITGRHIGVATEESVCEFVKSNFLGSHGKLLKLVVGKSLKADLLLKVLHSVALLDSWFCEDEYVPVELRADRSDDLNENFKKANQSGYLFIDQSLGTLVLNRPGELLYNGTKSFDNSDKVAKDVNADSEFWFINFSQHTTFIPAFLFSEGVDGPIAGFDLAGLDVDQPADGAPRNVQLHVKRGRPSQIQPIARGLSSSVRPLLGVVALSAKWGLGQHQPDSPNATDGIQALHRELVTGIGSYWMSHNPSGIDVKKLIQKVLEDKISILIFPEATVPDSLLEAIVTECDKAVFEARANIEAFSLRRIIFGAYLKPQVDHGKFENTSVYWELDELAIRFEEAFRQKKLSRWNLKPDQMKRFGIAIDDKQEAQFQHLIEHTLVADEVFVFEDSVLGRITLQICSDANLEHPKNWLLQNTCLDWIFVLIMDASIGLAPSKCMGIHRVNWISKLAESSSRSSGAKVLVANSTYFTALQNLAGASGYPSIESVRVALLVDFKDGKITQETAEVRIDGTQIDMGIL